MPFTMPKPSFIHRTARPVSQLSAQRGVTLIELMVGIAIGLLVIAVSLGALMASRGISGTVSEATLMQQQAAYAFRVIGQQIRQAGGLELSLTPSIMTTASDTNPAMSPVAFDAPDPTGSRPPFNRASSTLAVDSSSFTVGYQNYSELVTQPTSSSPITSSLLRDCLGQNSALSSGSSFASAPVLTSRVEHDSATNELKCTGTGSSGQQAVIGNVTDMRFRYLRQSAGTTNFQYRSASETVTDGTLSNIYGIEVCLELTGTEQVSTPGATYVNCDGVSTSYGNRLKMVFRNLYQLRSQGQT